MEQRKKRVIQVYRRRTLKRLDYAYSAGDLSDEDYQRLSHQVSEADRYSQLWKALGEARDAVAAAGGRNRYRRPRTVLTRRERAIRSQNRKWKPEQYWPVALAVAIVFGLLTLLCLYVVVEWIISLGEWVGLAG